MREVQISDMPSVIRSLLELSRKKIPNETVIKVFECSSKEFDRIVNEYNIVVEALCTNEGRHFVVGVSLKMFDLPVTRDGMDNYEPFVKNLKNGDGFIIYREVMPEEINYVVDDYKSIGG